MPLNLINLRTLLILFLLHLDPHYAFAESPQLSVEISSTQKEFFIGDEISIQFKITNNGGEEIEYADRSYDRSGRMNEYELEVLDERDYLVPEPKQTFGIIGGLHSTGKLRPGQSFSNTAFLNQWASIHKPGKYSVTGIYHFNHFSNRSISFRSDKIFVELKDRSPEQTANLVKVLSDQLAQSLEEAKRAEIARKLAFTGSELSLIPLLGVMFRSDPSSFWTQEAIVKYLPRTQKLRDELIAQVKRRGLADSMTYALKMFGVPRDRIVEEIERSLSSPSVTVASAAALASQQYYEPKLIPPLLSIARNDKSKKYDRLAVDRAIYALGLYREDSIVIETLKDLAAGPDRDSAKAATSVLASK